MKGNTHLAVLKETVIGLPSLTSERACGITCASINGSTFWHVPKEHFQACVCKVTFVDAATDNTNDMKLSNELRKKVGAFKCPGFHMFSTCTAMQSE